MKRRMQSVFSRLRIRTKRTKERRLKRSISCGAGETFRRKIKKDLKHHKQDPQVSSIVNRLNDDKEADRDRDSDFNVGEPRPRG